MDKVKTILSKIKMPKVKAKMPKVKVSLPKPNIKPWLDKIKPYMLKVWGVLKKTPEWGLKALKGLLVWLGKAVKESIAQLWTLLGFFIAWLTLTGTAQQIVGIATILSTIIWLATISLREEKDE
jgi:hypothetical protein